MNPHSNVDVILALAGQVTEPSADELANTLWTIDDADRAGLTQVCSALAARLPEVPSPAGAGTIALFLGAKVEGGLSPAHTYSGVRDAWLRWCATLAVSPDEDENDPEPDALTSHGLELLGRSLVAHLKRYPAAFEEFRGNQTMIAELDRKSHLSLGILWVMELVNKRSGRLLVLHIPTRRGFLFSYQNFSNCFHLFTLLQAALAGYLPDARMVDETVLAAATNQDWAEVRDEAWWHYGRGDVPRPTLDASIWGEGSPDEIPIIDGVQVILLWPPILQSRSWDSGFFGPAIGCAPTALDILSPLTPDEVHRWWQRLQLDAAGP